MDWTDVLKIVTDSVASIGVAGGMIFALSSWLGKVWARQILEYQGVSQLVFLHLKVN